MAEPLKAQFGPKVVRRLSADVRRVHAAFDQKAFELDALRGFEALELLDRGRHLGAMLHRHLPPAFSKAVDVLLATLPHAKSPAGGMASFYYLAHTEFVRQFGTPYFEDAMRALHAFTQCFTGEFAMRPYLELHTDACLARLEQWTRDPSEHVRRLVSESTRPRLPWAPRLRQFQADPAPVLHLLEKLRDDASLYVRRSVANNLNDIGKDHPAQLIATARSWLTDATPERRWIVQHALRSAIKRGDADALALLGFGAAAKLSVVASEILPARPRMGGRVTITCTLQNRTRRRQVVIVDLRVHFVKASGRSSPKVFKVTSLDLAAGSSAQLRKTVSLADLTTRVHYPGEHRVELQMNGAISPLGTFVLRRRSTSG